MYNMYIGYRYYIFINFSTYLNINGMYFSHLRFADAIVPISQIADELKDMMRQLNDVQTGNELSEEQGNALAPSYCSSQEIVYYD